jgi:hypothetical protein
MRTRVSEKLWNTTRLYLAAGTDFRCQTSWVTSDDCPATTDATFLAPLPKRVRYMAGLEVLLPVVVCMLY